MPTYTFEDTKTKKEFDKEMKISELKDFLDQNPNLIQIIKATPLVDPYLLGRYKTDSRFRDVLKKIKNEHAGTTVRTDNITEI